MPELIKPEEVVNSGNLRAAPTSIRFDSTQLSPLIITSAMLRHVIPTIGNALYAYLVAERTSGIANYNAALGATEDMFDDTDLEKLWTDGHLGMLCASAVIHVWLPYGTIQNRSQGQQMINTQYSQNADIKGIQFMADTLLQDVELLKNNVLTYLKANPVPNFELQTCNTTNVKDWTPYEFIIY